MKQNSLLIMGLALLASLSVNVYSCNNASSTDTATSDSVSIGDQEGFADLFVSDADADRWIKLYKDHRHKKDSSMSESVWYNRRVVSWLGNYFDTANSKIDGMRIYMIQYDKLVASGQRDTNQISILMVPTKARKADWSAWEHVPKPISLNHGELCPSNCK